MFDFWSLFSHFGYLLVIASSVAVSFGYAEWGYYSVGVACLMSACFGILVIPKIVIYAWLSIIVADFVLYWAGRMNAPRKDDPNRQQVMEPNVSYGPNSIMPMEMGQSQASFIRVLALSWINALCCVMLGGIAGFVCGTVLNFIIETMRPVWQSIVKTFGR